MRRRDKKHEQALRDFVATNKKPAWLLKFLLHLEALGAVGTYVSVVEDHLSLQTLLGYCGGDDPDVARGKFAVEVETIMNCVGAVEIEMQNGWSVASWCVDGDAAENMRAWRY